MAAKEIKTSSVPKSEYLNYIGKAEEFYEAMQDSLSKGRWNAVGLNAIHAGISVIDALLVFYHGMRSASPKHDDIIKLMTSLIKHKDLKNNISHIRNLIGMKNVVEYEGRMITKYEALSLSKHATRLIEWVKSMLP